MVPKNNIKPAVLTRSKASQWTSPSLDHNRVKAASIPKESPFLQALGVTGEELEGVWGRSCGGEGKTWATEDDGGPLWLGRQHWKGEARDGK